MQLRAHQPEAIHQHHACACACPEQVGPSSPHSTVLSLVEEAMVVEFRRRTLLPLDDVLGCLRDSIPKLTRSSLHRCLQRHGISRLPDNPDKAAKRGKFADTKIGYVHIDISEFRLWRGARRPLGLRRDAAGCSSRRMAPALFRPLFFMLTGTARCIRATAIRSLPNRGHRLACGLRRGAGRCREGTPIAAPPTPMRQGNRSLNND